MSRRHTGRPYFRPLGTRSPQTGITTHPIWQRNDDARLAYGPNNPSSTSYGVGIEAHTPMFLHEGPYLNLGAISNPPHTCPVGSITAGIWWNNDYPVGVSRLNNRVCPRWGILPSLGYVADTDSTGQLNQSGFDVNWESNGIFVSGIQYRKYRSPLQHMPVGQTAGPVVGDIEFEFKLYAQSDIVELHLHTYQHPLRSVPSALGGYVGFPPIVKWVSPTSYQDGASNQLRLHLDSVNEVRGHLHYYSNPSKFTIGRSQNPSRWGDIVPVYSWQNSPLVAQLPRRVFSGTIHVDGELYGTAYPAPISGFLFRHQSSFKTEPTTSTGHPQYYYVVGESQRNCDGTVTCILVGFRPNLPFSVHTTDVTMYAVASPEWYLIGVTFTSQPHPISGLTYTVSFVPG
jgi:hypothetical protein